MASFQCWQGYFRSVPCQNEIKRAIEHDKPSVLVHDHNEAKGGESLETLLHDGENEGVDAAILDMLREESILSFYRGGSFHRFTMLKIAECLLAASPMYLVSNVLAHSPRSFRPSPSDFEASPSRSGARCRTPARRTAVVRFRDGVSKICNVSRAMGLNARSKRRPSPIKQLKIMTDMGSASHLPVSGAGSDPVWPEFAAQGSTASF